MTAFKLGDRVRVRRDYISYTDCVGKTATVVDLDIDGTTGLRFDHANPIFHDCGGLCEDSRGWYITPRYIELMELLPIKGDDDEDCI